MKWTVTTDYSVPTSSWIPPMSVVLTPNNRLYIPGAGGTVYYVDNPDSDNATITGQLAFYGIANYDHSYDSNVKICTGLTSDSQGDLYYGFVVYGSTPLNLQSGIARMDPAGKGSWVAASVTAGDPSISEVLFNCAPALSNDESSLFIAVSSGSGGSGLGGSGSCCASIAPRWQPLALCFWWIRTRVKQRSCPIMARLPRRWDWTGMFTSAP